MPRICVGLTTKLQKTSRSFSGIARVAPSKSSTSEGRYPLRRPFSSVFLKRSPNYPQSANLVIRRNMSGASKSAYNKLACFDVSKQDGIAHVTMKYEPMNLLDETLATEFDTLTHELESDEEVRVIVLQSGLPEFWIAHSGLARVAAGGKSLSATRSFRQTQVLGERIRNMPKVTIAKVAGRCRGGGNEIAMAADMCFAAQGQAIFGQPEVGLGLVPGGGGTQRLPRLMGRARALEILLSADDFSAADAERMGCINRALPPAELDAYVDGLAKKIARLPPHAIGHIKRAVDTGAFSSVSEGLLVEAQNGDQCVATQVTRDRVKSGLDAGLETVEGELNLVSIIRKLD